MPELEWKATAVVDLRAIVTYIADDNPAAAQVLLDEIENKVASLPAHPRRCRPGRVAGTREMVVRPNYIVVYVEDPQHVTVLRVLHAAQMWPWRERISGALMRPACCLPPAAVIENIFAIVESCAMGCSVANAGGSWLDR